MSNICHSACLMMDRKVSFKEHRRFLLIDLFGPPTNCPMIITIITLCGRWMVTLMLADRKCKNTSWVCGIYWRFERLLLPPLRSVSLFAIH